MAEKHYIDLLPGNDKEALKSVIAEIVQSGKNNTRSGITTLLTGMMGKLLDEILDEMTRDGLIDQKNEEAIYELTEEGKKELL